MTHLRPLVLMGLSPFEVDHKPFSGFTSGRTSQHLFCPSEHDLCPIFKRPIPHCKLSARPFLNPYLPSRRRFCIAATLLACSSHVPRMLLNHQVLDLSDRSNSHYKVDDAKSERRGKALPEPSADAHRQRRGKSDAVLIIVLDQCLLQHYSALVPLSTVSLL